MAEQGEPGRPALPSRWTVVPRQNTADDVSVNLQTEGLGQ